MQAFPVDNTNMFEWPEVLSAAMHSVRTSMNLHPPVSRLHVPRDEQLVMELNTFMTNVGPVYYDTVLRGTVEANNRPKSWLQWRNFIEVRYT